jgi:hypothetical protein
VQKSSRDSQSSAHGRVSRQDEISALVELLTNPPARTPKQQIESLEREVKRLRDYIKLLASADEKTRRELLKPHRVKLKQIDDEQQRSSYEEFITTFNSNKKYAESLFGRELSDTEFFRIVPLQEELEKKLGRRIGPQDLRSGLAKKTMNDKSFRVRADSRTKVIRNSLTPNEKRKLSRDFTKPSG